MDARTLIASGQESRTHQRCENIVRRTLKSISGHASKLSLQARMKSPMLICPPATESLGGRHTNHAHAHKSSLQRAPLWRDTDLTKSIQQSPPKTYFHLPHPSPLPSVSPTPTSSPSFEIQTTGAPRTRRRLQRCMLPRLHAHSNLTCTPQQRLQRHSDFRSGFSVE